MSYYYEKIRTLISHHTIKKPLYDFYTDQVIKKLNNINNPNHNCFLMLQDLKIHLKQHYDNVSLTVDAFNKTKDPLPEEGDKKQEVTEINISEEITAKLLSKLFFYKSLHLRAIILDTIDTDYWSDVQTFYEPEKWIIEVIKKINETFDGFEFKNDFVIYFGGIITKTFISKNKKFGFNGNQLLINMMYYEKCFKIKLSECTIELEQNFVEGRIMNSDELKNIIRENDSANNNDKYL